MTKDDPFDPLPELEDTSVLDDRDLIYVRKSVVGHLECNEFSVPWRRVANSNAHLEVQTITGNWKVFPVETFSVAFFEPQNRIRGMRFQPGDIITFTAQVTIEDPEDEEFDEVINQKMEGTIISSADGKVTANNCYGTFTVDKSAVISHKHSHATRRRSNESREGFR